MRQRNLPLARLCEIGDTCSVRNDYRAIRTMKKVAAMTVANNTTHPEKLKVVELAARKKGAASKIAEKGGVSLSHVSRVLSGERPATAKVRRATALVFRVPQHTLVFPMDEQGAA